MTIINTMRAMVGLPPKAPTTKGQTKVGGYSGPASKPGAPPKTMGTLPPLGHGPAYCGGNVPALEGLEPYSEAWLAQMQELLPRGAVPDTPRLDPQGIKTQVALTPDPAFRSAKSLVLPPDPAKVKRQALKDFTYGLIALQIAELGTCCRLKVGCVLLTEEGRVAGMGYNGAGPGMAHCNPETCNVECRCGRTLHAEQNALFSRTATPYTAYTTHEPCLNCTKELILAGVRRVIFLKPYASIAPAEREARQEWLDHYHITWDHRPTHGVS